MSDLVRVAVSVDEGYRFYFLDRTDAAAVGCGVLEVDAEFLARFEAAWAELEAVFGVVDGLCALKRAAMAAEESLR